VDFGFLTADVLPTLSLSKIVIEETSIAATGSTMSDDRLCAKCQEIVTQRIKDLSTGALRDSGRWLHHADSGALLRAVKQDCYICNWTWRECRWSKYHGHRAVQPIHHTTYGWVNSIDLRMYTYDTVVNISSMTVFTLLKSTIDGNSYHICMNR
jgi:hypothetical protein